MIAITKNNTPNVLKKYQSDPVLSYSDITSSDKDKIKEEMLREQHYLCAYCMSRIEMGSSTIEHWLPQNPSDTVTERDNSLSYRNMLAVCKSSRGKPKNEQICDVHRENEPLTVNPCIASTIEKIKYKTNGVIFSDDEDINHDLNVTLNLNCISSSLPVNRKEALQALHRKIFNETTNGRNKKTLCTSILNKYRSEQFYPPYFGILEWQLKKWIAQEG